MRKMTCFEQIATFYSRYRGLGYTFNQTYTYDNLNRLATAGETYNGSSTWSQTYSYDRYGNRNISAGTGATSLTFSASNNKITTSGYTYDSGGSMIGDPSGKSFTYDSENKQTAVTNGGTLGNYAYDGDGKRVKKYNTSTGDDCIFIYDAAGKLIEERDLSGNLQTSYVYAGGRLLSTETSGPTTNYLTADHLGSPRINTDGSGNVTARHDYMPFGEEIFTGLTPQRTSLLGYPGSDGVRKQFTGYERDIESDLDFAQARYYNKNHGRFTSVDPLMASASVGNPQTLNRYAYVGNNPVNITDPAGLDWYQQDSGGRTNYQWFDGEADKGWTAVDFGAVGNRYARINDASLGDQSIGTIYLNKYGNSYLNQSEYSEMTARNSYGFTNAIADTGIGTAKWGWNGMAGVSEAFYAVAGRASWEYAFTGTPREMPSVTYFEYSNQVQANAGTAMTMVSFLAPAFKGRGTAAFSVVPEVSSGTNVAVHGNSLSSLRPTWGYRLFGEDGTFLKNGITSQPVAEARYTKAFMSDKFMLEKIPFSNRRAARMWEINQNTFNPGPLNIRR